MSACKCVPSLFGGQGPGSGRGKGRVRSPGKLTLPADRQMGWQEWWEATPLWPREHNAHAPDLSIVPAPPPLHCQGPLKEAVSHGHLPGLAFTAIQAVAGLVLLLRLPGPAPLLCCPKAPGRSPVSSLLTQAGRQSKRRGGSGPQEATMSRPLCPPKPHCRLRAGGCAGASAGATLPHGG